MSSLRGSNLVFHLTTSIESDLIPCSDHPDSHFSKPPPVGPAALSDYTDTDTDKLYELPSCRAAGAPWQGNCLE